VIWAVVAVAAATLASWTGYAIGSHQNQLTAALRRAAGRAAASALAPGTCKSSAVGPAGQQLLAEMPPLPAGAKRVQPTQIPAVMSVSRYVHTLYSTYPAELGQLKARCFQAAAFFEYVLPNGMIVATYLVRFDQLSGAVSYARATFQADLTDTPHASHAAVSGVSDGQIIRSAKLDGYGNTRSRALGDVGNVMILIHVYVPAHLPTVAAMARLLRSEAARL
jgi:hypothetical protein